MQPYHHRDCDCDRDRDGDGDELIITLQRGLSAVGDRDHFVLVV